jgi:hypothetical protein
MELAREIAKRSQARFVDIPREKRVTRSTSYDNMVAKYGNPVPINVPDGPPMTAKRLATLRVTNCLEAEQRRLIEEWNR